MKKKVIILLHELRKSKNCRIAPYLVAGLCASGLHSSQAIIISGNGVVMLDALLGTALFVDFHQRKGRRVVLHQPHLRRHCHHSGHWRDGRRGERDRDGGEKGGNTMEGQKKGTGEIGK